MNRPRSTLATLALACLVVAAAVAWLNRHHRVQQNIYEGRYLELARFLAGDPDAQPIITYPVWGYPLVLAALPAPATTSIACQLLLATASLVLVVAAARGGTTAADTVLAVLAVLAVPWYALASARMADVWSASLGVAGVCLLARAVRPAASPAWTLASGLAFGLSVNFRSDFLAYLVALPVLTALLAPPLMRRAWRRVAAVTAAGILALVPWGLFRVYHGEPFGLTSTNGGMVMYNALGFHGNAWGIVSHDSLRHQEAEAALGEGVEPHSAAGDALFRARFLAAVRERPLEYARKVVHNLVTTVKYGFYTIEVEPYLEGDDAVRFEVVKEQLKALAGARVNPLDVARFRELGLWQDDFSLASIPARMWLVLALPLVAAGLSALYLVTLAAATVWIVVRERTLLERPIVVFTTAAVIVAWGTLGLLQNEPRQANVLYVLGLPAVAHLVGHILTRAGGARGTPLYGQTLTAAGTGPRSVVP